MSVTTDDLVKSLNKAGVDTPEKLDRFISLAALQVQRVATMTAADKARTDGDAARATAIAAASALDGDAAELQDKIVALISAGE